MKAYNPPSVQKKPLLDSEMGTETLDTLQLKADLAGLSYSEQVQLLRPPQPVSTAVQQKPFREGSTVDKAMEEEREAEEEEAAKEAAKEQKRIAKGTKVRIKSWTPTDTERDGVEYDRYADITFSIKLILGRGKAHGVQRGFKVKIPGIKNEGRVHEVFPVACKAMIRAKGCDMRDKDTAYIIPK